MDWSVNDSFKRYACFVFLKCFVLLVVFVDVSACLLPTCARNCVLSNVFRSPFCFAGLCLFCLLFIFVYLWKFLRIVCVCVLLSSFFFAHMGLNLSFPHRFSFSVEYKFALLTLSFKNFYIQSHCLPTFFLLLLLFFFCWSGLLLYHSSFGFFANFVFLFF